MYLEKHILTQSQKGTPYCNAIDENPYDSSEWANRMPANSIDFSYDEHGSVITTFTQCFACYDGWDSDSYHETHHSMESAVNSAWLSVYNYNAGRCPINPLPATTPRKHNAIYNTKTNDNLSI